jgi:hypothetical protein
MCDVTSFKMFAIMVSFLLCVVVIKAGRIPP